MNKLTLKQFEEKLYKICGNQIILKKETYINTHTKACFIDEKHGEFWSTPNRITNGGKHPQRKKDKLKSLYILTECEINKKLKDLYNTFTITVRYDTYKNLFSYCTFIDSEYGEWSCLPCHLFRNKCLHPTRSLILRRKTNLQIYGVGNPSQNKDISLKQAKSSNKSFILYHWKTNEELICIGSYEKKVIEYLNQNKIEFKWQPKVFEIKELNTTYRPDLYLIDKDRWIEVKGYFRRNALEKWNWFHENYSNSELWNKEKLKQMGIL